MADRSFSDALARRPVRRAGSVGSERRLLPGPGDVRAVRARCRVRDGAAAGARPARPVTRGGCAGSIPPRPCWCRRAGGHRRVGARDLGSARWEREFDLVVMTGHAFQVLVHDERGALRAGRRTAGPRRRRAVRLRDAQSRRPAVGGMAARAGTGGERRARGGRTGPARGRDAGARGPRDVQRDVRACALGAAEGQPQHAAVPRGGRAWGVPRRAPGSPCASSTGTGGGSRSPPPPPRSSPSPGGPDPEATRRHGPA